MTDYTLHVLPHYICHTPYAVRVDHYAFIQVRVMVDITDQLMA